MGSYSRRSFLRVTAYTSGAALFAACAPQATPAAPVQPTTGASTAPVAGATSVSATPKGQLVYAAAGLAIANMDPHNLAPPADFPVRMAFDPLLAPDEKGQIVPVLAASYRNIDNNTWEFKLKPNIKFASGNPVTAAAIKWNFDRVANPENKLQAAARIPTYDKTEVIDELTFRMVTKSADPIWPRRIFAVLIADPVEGAKPGFTSNPGPNAGSGLFKITEFDSGRSVTLEAVTTSWKGMPKLAKIITKSVPELGTIIAGLKTGDVDLSLIAADRVDDLVKGGLAVGKVSQANIYQIWIQSNRGGPLADKRVRQALNLAIDRESIIKELYAGSGQVASQWVGADGFGYNPALKSYGFDPKKAKELLAEAGFPNGFPITIETLGTSVVFKGFQDASIGFLGDIGVKLNVSPLETNVFVNKIFSGPKAPLFFNGIQYGPAFDADFALNWWSNKLVPADIIMYDNPAFQTLFDQSRNEFDEKKRLDALQKAQQVMYDDYAGIPIMQPVDNWVYTKRVQGFTPHPVGIGYANWQNVSVSS